MIGRSEMRRRVVWIAATALGLSACTDRPRPAQPHSTAIGPFDQQAARRHQEVSARDLGVPVETINSIGMVLRLVPPGDFLMGSEPSEPGHWPSEGPRHWVRITQPFYMGVYEVTQAQFQQVMGFNPSHFADSGELPVEQVSWNDAVAFCRRLSEMPAERSTGWIYRLPTEAEWEYACRAGTGTPFHFGSELNGTQANCNGEYPYGTDQRGPSLGRPTPVGSYAPNAFGLFDMHGNVWEWVADWYDDRYYGRSPVDDPPGPQSGTYRVRRGGGWLSLAVRCRSANRDRDEPDVRHYDVGFRVVRVPVE